MHSRGDCHGSLGHDSLHDGISPSRPRPLPRTRIPVVITYHNKMRRYGVSAIDDAVKYIINSSLSSIFAGRSIHFMTAINKARSNTNCTRVWVRDIPVAFDLKKHGVCLQSFYSILFVIFIIFCSYYDHFKVT